MTFTSHSHLAGMSIRVQLIPLGRCARLRQFEPFAGEVVPGVHDAVAKARRGA